MITPRFLAALAVITLLGGCRSGSAPTAAPSTAPSLGITTMAPPTPTPTTAGPTSAPSATSATPAPTTPSVPTDTPTGSASAEPTAPPTTTPGVSPGAGLDERDLLFHDDLSDPASDWGVGTTEGGTVAYVDGALQFDLSTDGAWIWSRRVTPAVHGVLRVAAEFVPASAGSFGLLCGSTDEDLVGALMATDGSWRFVSIGDDGAEELLGQADAGLDVGIDQSTVFALECAGTNGGALRLQLWALDTGPLGIYEADEGAPNFDRAGIYAEAASDAYSVRVEEVAVFGAGPGDGSLTPAAEELLTHVPGDLRDSCYQGIRPPYQGLVAETTVSCFIGEPGDDGAELAEYSAYLSSAAMDEAYQQHIDTFGMGDDMPSCRDGSGEHSYTIGDEESGRVLCVDQLNGVRFTWTDERLDILSTMVDFDGSYSAAYDDWTTAGPNV